MTLRALLLLSLAAPAVAAEAAADLPDSGEIIVTAARRTENVQDVPISVAVVGGPQLEATQTFNVTRLVQLIPSVNFYSSNPRNSNINIRGLGAPFGLTNDGIEQGVGFYVDGVYYARPAAATLDFVDIERIEVLKGPQGTLYGKNTTAGALNITTRAPSFDWEGRAEFSYGNYTFLQAKASVSGPLSDNLAVRIGFSGTRRDGTLLNTRTQEDVQQLGNVGVRGALLWKPSDSLKITLAGDYAAQNPRCCTQVWARVAPTLRNANRQYAALAAASNNYAPPSFNPFDRLVDPDSPLQAKQTFGGASLTVDWDAEPGTLTSITAFRFWDWFPQNDRDFIGLPITTVSANTSFQKQYTQELRWVSNAGKHFDYVVGAFAYRQTLYNTPLQAQGASASLWLLGPGANNPPALLDGLTQRTTVDYTNDSLALYGRVTWKPTTRLRLIGGVRFNYDRKDAAYDARVSGGLVTSDPAVIARKNGVLGPQAYRANFDDFNISGDATIAYDLAEDIHSYVTYARSFKSGGVNLGGLPTDAAGNPLLGSATVKPETVDHIELGLKTQWLDRRLTANVALFQTEVGDYQTTVVNAQIGVLRGYLANARKVRVRGAELELAATISDSLSIQANGTYLDGRYVSFTDAPPPIELTGGPQVVNASGQRLPGVSEWQGSLNVDFHPKLAIFGPGELISGFDVSARTNFSSSPTPSAFTYVPGYTLVNARLGWRSDKGHAAFFWIRNAFDHNYFDFLTAAPGGSGLIVGQVGDPRTYGFTLQTKF